MSGINLHNTGAPETSGASNERNSERRSRDRVADAPARDFYDVMTRLDIQSISADIEPYMKKVRETIEQCLPGTTIRQVDRVPNAWVFHRNDPDGIAVVYGVYFVNQSDLPSAEGAPVSARLDPLRRRIKEMFGSTSNNIVQLVEIMTGYAGDMERYDNMARSIVTTLKMETDPTLRDITVLDLGGPSLEVDYSEDRVKAQVRRYSPHGVIPRIESGLSITAKPRKDRDGRDRDDDDVEDFDFTQDNSFVSIGGYLEIGDWIPDRENRETGGKYELRYNVTAIASRIPHAGVAALAIGVLAPLVANRRFGLNQFARFTKNSANLGLVMADPENKDRLFEIDDMRDLELFYDRWFHAPDIVLNYQWGHEQIPGMWRMAAGGASDRNHAFIGLLSAFLNVDEPTGRALRMSERWGTRIDGYYGDANGHLRDSRDFDYCHLANQLGVNILNDERRDIMCTITEDRRWTRDRQKLTAEQLPNFVPMSETLLSGINPDFIRFINESARASGVDIIDRNESRGYGTGRSMRRSSQFGDPRDMGSMVNTESGKKWNSRNLLDD